MDKTIERAKVKLDSIREWVAKDMYDKYFLYREIMPTFDSGENYAYWDNGGNAVEIEPIPELENVAPEDSLRRVV